MGEVASSHGLDEAEHHRSRVLAAAGGGLNVIVGPSTGACGGPLGQCPEDIGEDLLGDGCWELVGSGHWWWRLLGVKGTEGGAHLLCWVQDGLSLEGTSGSRDAAHDEAVVDAGGGAMVYAYIGIFLAIYPSGPALLMRLKLCQAARCGVQLT
jgi:hypothetical protein